MKHGTRLTDPALIYTSDAGIDPRYGDAGMFGRAAYFAERALYSHDYAHTPAGAPGHRQMFIAMITAGKVHECAPNSTLRHPPSGFDSVRGVVRGTDYYAFMLYETKTSFPAYLVTYKA